MTTENEQIEIELDDKTAAIAHILAEEKGISVDQYITELLTEAMENGYIDRPENVTTDDSLV